MLRALIISTFILVTGNVIGQTNDPWAKLFEWPKNSDSKKVESKSEQHNTTPGMYEVIDGDTIYVLYHADIVVMDAEYKKKYDDHLYYIKRMLPYARLITQMNKDYDSVLAEMEKRREKKDFLGHQNDLAVAQFEDLVKKMSLKEGQFLMKLVHRESGQTVHSIISKFQGNAKSFLWQCASRLGGADLKLKYDPEGEDKITEEIMKKIEKGEIKVKTLKLDPKAIEKKEAAEAKAKEKKKEEKKARKAKGKK